MLPIYEAIEIKEIIHERVGRTRPWIVVAKTPKGLEQFVVKMFTPQQVNVQGSLQSEVICNFLATHFDLKVPEAALIEIPDQITMGLKPEEQQQYLRTDPRLKFGTRLLSNAPAALPELEKRYYTKRIQIDSLYAFDNLIRNADRGQQKTNLLVSNKDAFLIDHELALKTNELANITIDTYITEPKYTEHHLFHRFLKKTRKAGKRDFFNEFQENLMHLPIKTLQLHLNKLAHQGFSVDPVTINNWVSGVKAKSAKFVTLLRESVE